MIGEMFALAVLMVAISVAVGVVLRDMFFPNDPGRTWDTEVDHSDVYEIREGVIGSVRP